MASLLSCGFYCWYVLICLVSFHDKFTLSCRGDSAILGLCNTTMKAVLSYTIDGLVGHTLQYNRGCPGHAASNCMTESAYLYPEVPPKKIAKIHGLFFRLPGPSVRIPHLLSALGAGHRYDPVPQPHPRSLGGEVAPTSLADSPLQPAGYPDPHSHPHPPREGDVPVAPLRVEDVLLLGEEKEPLDPLPRQVPRPVISLLPPGHGIGSPPVCIKGILFLGARRSPSRCPRNPPKKILCRARRSPPR